LVDKHIENNIFNRKPKKIKIHMVIISLFAIALIATITGLLSSVLSSQKKAKKISFAVAIVALLAAIAMTININ